MNSALDEHSQYMEKMQHQMEKQQQTIQVLHGTLATAASHIKWCCNRSLLTHRCAFGLLPCVRVILQMYEDESKHWLFSMSQNDAKVTELQQQIQQLNIQLAERDTVQQQLQETLLDNTVHYEQQLQHLQSQLSAADATKEQLQYELQQRQSQAASKSGMEVSVQTEEEAVKETLPEKEDDAVASAEKYEMTAKWHHEQHHYESTIELLQQQLQQRELQLESQHEQHQQTIVNIQVQIKALHEQVSRATVAIVCCCSFARYC